MVTRRTARHRSADRDGIGPVTETSGSGEGGPGRDGAGSDGDAERSVFSKLPRSRPGVRSPRRDEGEGARARGTGAAGATAGPRPRVPKRPTEPRPRARAAAPPPPPPRGATPPDDRQSGGVEDLAWAGITVAAEAATLGVRLMGRAFEAVREAVERR